MKNVLVVLISVVLSLAAFHFIGEGKGKSESAFDRVIATNTLRCGYALWPKYLDMDPNTKQLSGAAYDYVMALGESLNLKIEWTKELGWGEFAEALKQNHIDAFCYTAWQNSQRGRVVDFVRPILYTPVYAYARSDDKRFDNRYEKLNAPDVTVTSIDGTTNDYAATQNSPDAKRLALPELSDAAQMFMNIVQDKADIAYNDPTAVAAFLKTHPGTLRQVEGPPLMLSGASLAVAKGENDLQQMLSVGTDQLIGSGRIDAILDKNGFAKGDVFRVKLTD